MLGSLPTNLQWPPAELPYPQNTALPTLQVSGYAPNYKCGLLILQSFRILLLEVIEVPNNNRYLQ